MNAQPHHRPAHSQPTKPLVSFPRNEVTILTVILVENDQASRQALARALCELGCRVLEVSTGVEAIDLAEAEPPDAIFLTARLPDTDGLQMIADLKESPTTRHIPLIVLAPAILRDEELACLAAGAAGFILKPVNLVELQHLLANLAGLPDEEDAAAV
jgi:two-component system, sensor histidine kinase SagS